MKINRRSFLEIAALTSAQRITGANAFGFKLNKEERLTILHTNDTHSRIDPFPEDGGRNAGLGGAARRATLIRQIRSEAENVLLLDAGDSFQGTPYFNFYKGELDFKVMSAMGYDASTIGNHDFDAGLQGLHDVLPFANFPLITANYDFSKTLLKGCFAPYKIFRKGGIKIGVFGLGVQLDGLVAPKLTGDTIRQPSVPVAIEMVQELKNKKCHLIICLSHLSYYGDRALAEKVSGIDIIIGGHSHTFMDKPEHLTNDEGHTSLIHQVGFAGIRLGRIDLTFSRSKDSFSVDKSGSIAVNSSIPAGSIFPS